VGVQGMPMLGWLKQKMANAIAERQVENDMADAVRIIKKHGGSDAFCAAYVQYLHKDKVRLSRFRNGLMKPEEYPLPRNVIATAAINSMMAARRDLRTFPDNEDFRNRLKIAEHAFLMSWLHLDDVEQVLFQKDVADERFRQGEQALENWRKADIDKFPFHIPI
jgi:hypothetical protein